MARTNRTPLQVSPEFKKRLDEIQRKIMMAQGQKKSLRQITDDIVSSPMFPDIEKSLVKTDKMRVDFKIKFDKRMFE